MSAPMSLRGIKSSAFYTHRTRISTLFIQKSTKMPSITCQLWKKEVYVAFFKFELYTQRKVTIGFTNIQWDSLITMRNNFNLWKNICQVRNIFHYIYILHLKIRLHLEILRTIFFWVIHILLTPHHSYIFIMFPLCRRLVMLLQAFKSCVQDHAYDLITIFIEYTLRKSMGW